MTFIATIQNPKHPTPQKCRLTADSSEAAVSMLERQGYTVIAIVQEEAKTPPPIQSQPDSPRPVAPSSEPAFNASAAKAKVGEASRDALDSLKLLWRDPFNNVAPAVEALGASRAMGAGIAFAAASALGVLGVAVAYFHQTPPLAVCLKIILFGLVPFAALTAASRVLRALCRAGGPLGYDAFIAGTALLPSGMATASLALLGLGNMEVVAALTVAAASFAVLFLFIGYAKVFNLSGRAAFAGVPAALLLAAWLSKIVFATLFHQGFLL